MTQADFARLTGVDARTVARWEAGAARPTGAAEAVLNGVNQQLKRSPNPEQLVAFLVGAVALGGLAYLIYKLLEKES